MNQKNVWHPVDKHPEIYYGHYIVPNFMSNAIAINTSIKEWVLVSPGEPLLEDWLKHFGAEGMKINIIFPNHYHYLGVARWLEQYPDACLYASKKAIVALQEKGFTNITAIEDEQPTLPSGYSILIPPGHRGGDVWLSKQNKASGSVWITCDSFQNYSRLSNQPIARILQRVLGTAPGLKLSQFVKWLLLDNRRAFKRWALNQLDVDQPTTLIPSHGVVEQDDNLSKRLKRLLDIRI